MAAELELSGSKLKPAAGCRTEADLLRWLTNVRQSYSPSNTTVNCSDVDSKCLVPELICCSQHSSRFVCFAASAALRLVLHSLKQDDLRKTMEELLMLRPPSEFAERALPLAQQLQIETVTSFMKEAKVNLQALNWPALIGQWKLCVLECYSCPHLLVPTLTLTKRIWKSDLSGMYKRVIASRCELIVGLCKHCTQNVEVKKLLRICQYLLQSAAGSEEGGEDCLKLIMERALSSEVFTKRLAHWIKQCVSTDLSSLPLLQPLPRDCTDEELLPAVIRRSVLLVLQGVASLLALDEGRQKGLVAQLEQTCQLLEAVASEWRGRRNFSVPTHMEMSRVLLYLISEEDSALMETLLLSTQIHILLGHQDQTDSQHHLPESLVLLLDAADPHHLFVGFMDSVAFDHSTLMEFIVSEDVKFMHFFTEYLHYTVVTWDHFAEVCQRHCDTAVTSGLGLCDSSSEDSENESCSSGDLEGGHETDSNFQQGGMELGVGMKVVPDTDSSYTPSPKRMCVGAMLPQSCSSLECDKSPPPVTLPSAPTDVSCAVLECDKSPPPVTPPSLPTDVSCAVLKCDKSPPPVTPPSAPTDVSCAVLEAVMQCFAQLHLVLGNMAAKGLLQETQTVHKLLHNVLQRFSAVESD